jgi:hypothetical protein
MLAGSTKGLDRHPSVRLPLTQDGARTEVWLTPISALMNGENNASTTSVVYLRTSCRHLDLPPRDYRRSGNQRKKLPHGAAMSLGEFQENMHVGESLPITGPGEHYTLSAAVTLMQ